MTRVPPPRGGVYSVKYPFVYDDVFLIAEMDQKKLVPALLEIGLLVK